MYFNWNNIRPLNNSLNDGFEELVCQIAAKEKFSGQKVFRRLGKPDAGKEAYWELSSGKLHMWQAKYFTGSLTSSQWTQIDESVKKAIDNHTNLEKYYVCMPLDLPDPKVKGKKSGLDKWKEKSKSWQAYAASEGLSVEFIYWGSSELVARLSKKENEGLKYFWFNQEEFLDQWFEDRNQNSINALGARYTEELNFELPIARIFDGLSRDAEFENQIHKYYNKFLEKFRGLHLQVKNEELQSEISKLSETVKAIRLHYESIPFIGNDPLPLSSLAGLIENCFKICSNLSRILYRLREAEEKGKERKEYTTRPFSGEFSEVNVLSTAIREFERFLQEPTVHLANHPFLMIAGAAGIGKSHLIADVIGKRKERKQQSLLLLGEDFTTEEMPWTQILTNLVRKPLLDEFVFLGVLNAKAESERSRIIIFIDAINEGNGRKIWPKRLKSFIQSIKKYPWLGLVVSIRSSFIKLVAPTDEIDRDLITRITHKGFAGLEYRAAKRFFQHYDIVQPTSPLLNPEFQNPLFLKLFCQSLFHRRLYQIPEGYEGITTIIDYFLESINIKLARPEHLDYDERRQLVKSVVEKVLYRMVESDKDYVPYLEADDLVENVFRNACSNREPCLKRLISEGVFNEDLHWDEDDKPVDVIYFAYQRFQDHLTVSLLLDRHLNKTQPEVSFKSGKLHDLIKNKSTAYANQNLVEALSIQVPERVNKELFEVAPHAKMFRSIAEGFIQSLVWRRKDSIGENSRNYVTKVIMRDEDLLTQFLEVTILTSMKPSFYFNAERLHTFLMGFSLVERDASWTIWLQDKYDAEYESTSAVKRIIDWAWDNEPQEHIQDDAIFLGCITLGWFLTSPNRYLRDAATKALVCQLQHRTYLIIPLLEKFKGVNDPYVLERIYAACYGAVLRTVNTSNLVSISEYIYKEIFNQEEVYPHILLRDYARNVIEFTRDRQYTPKIDIAKARPPYKSDPLPKKFPTNAEIDKKYEPKNKKGYYGGESWGATAILRSMRTEYGRGTGGYGDFGRYTFERAFDDWKVNCDGLSNYAVQRIFELGYDPKVFTQFDSEQGSGRTSGHKERIGKKYQWIVFYELLARTSDLCDLTDESDWDRPKKTIPYDGPWYPYVRDIDPSMVVKETLADRYPETPVKHWWFNIQYHLGNQECEKWIVDTKDIPLPQEMLEVKDKQGDSWLWLETHPEWGESGPLGEDRYASERKRLWMQVRSYLVKKDLRKLQSSFTNEFHRGGLPEARSMYTIFDREYYWSPAFNYFNKQYYDGKEWVGVYKKQTDEEPITQVYRTTEFFNWEEEYDCSKASAIQFYKPTKKIWDGLGLNFSSKEGELVDKTGKTICFDPSVYHKSISGLLIRKNELVEWLKKEKLTLVWGVVGEKQVLGSDYRNRKGPYRLNISGLYTLNGDLITGKLNFLEE